MGFPLGFAMGLARDCSSSSRGARDMRGWDGSGGGETGNAVRASVFVRRVSRVVLLRIRFRPAKSSRVHTISVAKLAVGPVCKYHANLECNDSEKIQ